MAQNAFGRLLRSGSGLQQTLSPLVQKRCQSTRVVPSFHPTSSEALDQKLDRIRQELFVPMYFAEHQKRLVFRDRYRRRLNEEKVKVTIGEEEFLLRHMSRQQLPDKQEINQAVEAMKTYEDWKNFIPLLIGSRQSKYKFKSRYYEKWIRLADKADALGVILEAAKQSARTGFSLSDRDVVFKFAYALHKKAQAAGFKGEQTGIALRYAEQAAQMMEWPEHTDPKIAEDPKRQPFFISLLTELTAARAIEESAAADVDGKARSYLQKLLATWDYAALNREQETWYDTEEFLQEVALIYSGLHMATKVKTISADKALMTSITEKMHKLKAVASDGVEKVQLIRKENPTKGLLDARAIL